MIRKPTMHAPAIREYAPADLPAMIAIWNAVVEKDFLGSEP